MPDRSPMITGATGPRNPIRVLVADDQDIVRDGLVTVLSLIEDILVVGAAADGVQAVALAAAEQPDVVLMDLRMPELDGVGEATTEILAAQPKTAVLVLTTYADDISIACALRAGARGYLTKDAGEPAQRAAVVEFDIDGVQLDPAGRAVAPFDQERSQRLRGRRIDHVPGIVPDQDL